MSTQPPANVAGVLGRDLGSTNMARRYGRAPRGERLRAGVPHGHQKTTTVVAGLRTRGMVAPFVLDRPCHGAHDTVVAHCDQVGFAPERIAAKSSATAAHTGGTLITSNVITTRRPAQWLRFSYEGMSRP